MCLGAINALSTVAKYYQKKLILASIDLGYDSSYNHTSSRAKESDMENLGNDSTLLLVFFIIIMILAAVISQSEWFTDLPLWKNSSF